MESENQKPEPGKQQCFITINAVVDTDEDGLDIKKRITEALKDKPGIQINFGLSNAPRQR